jgi:hypothetical protein
MATLISLIVLVLIIWLAFYIVDLIPIPAPFGNIIKVIIIIIAIVELLSYTNLLH